VKANTQEDSAMPSRRVFLAGAAGAPAILSGAARRGRTYADVERMLSTGDVKGKLSRSELPTPALILELDAFEANVAKMTAWAGKHKRALRPHAKTHKCPEIALALQKAGAVGACAAKISEAEALASGGVTILLVTSACIGPHKIERAVRLAKRRPETMFVVDDAGNAADLDAAAGSAGLKLNLAIDLLIGNRTGVEPGGKALALAQRIASLRNVRLAAIQAYAGHASHTVGFENRRKVSREVMGQAVETRRLLEKSGIACPLLTGGSTGTYNIDCDIEGVDELQPGSYMFMDIDYSRIGGREGPLYRDFAQSLFVVATVISRPSAGSAIVDAGYKAFSTDRSFGPELRHIEGVKYSWGGDEHGRLNVAQASAPIRLGDRLEFVVPHCDPTVNLYDRIYAVRGEQVEAAWRIAARGMSQ